LVVCITIVALLAVADAAKTKPAAKKAKKMEIAVQDENAFSHPDANVRRISFMQARGLGATVVRKMISLHLIHPCRGAVANEEVASLDRLILEAKANGMIVQMLFTGVAAEWGLPRGCTGFRPTGANPNVAEYKAIVAKYVQRFAKLGVRRFSTWNEPNHPGFLCVKASKSSSDGDIDNTKCDGTKLQNYMMYAKLHRAAYAVIQKLKKQKKISSKVQVWFGEFAGSGKMGAEEIFKKGKIIADAYAFHPYQYCTPPNTYAKKYIPGSTCRKSSRGGMASAQDTQDFIGKWFKKGRFVTSKGKRPPLYLTEFGYHVTGKSAIPENYRVKWYPMAMSVAKKAGARGMVLYQMFPSGPGRWDTSILLSNGKPSATYNALRAWAIKNKYKVSTPY